MPVSSLDTPADGTGEPGSRQVASDCRNAPEQPNSNVKVWDTQYCPSSKAFSVFREAICSTFMPWSPEFKSEQDFEGRVEGIRIEEGSIGHVRMTPLVAARTTANIANSPVDGYYANYILSGGLNVEQSGRSSLAKPGDLVVYDTSLPVTLTERQGTRYEDLGFLIPKADFSAIRNAHGHFDNVLIPGDRLIGPLLSCLTYLSENLASSSKDELIALYDAFVSLLPLAAGCFAGTNKEKSSAFQASYLLREVLAFVNRNISNTDLSPHQAAKECGISVRYVHKLFTCSGVTFSSYVTAKRLDYIRSELISPSCRHQPISVLAYRWGFGDLSTFNRAFKHRFGCTPSWYRMHSGC